MLRSWSKSYNECTNVSVLAVNEWSAREFIAVMCLKKISNHYSLEHSDYTLEVRFVTLLVYDYMVLPIDNDVFFNFPL